MNRITPQRLTFDRFEELIKEIGSKTEANLHIGNGFAVGLNLTSLLRYFSTDTTPIRITDLRIGLVRSGSARVIFNLIPRHLTAGSLVFVGCESIIQMMEHTPDFNFAVVAVTTDLLKVILPGNIPSSLSGHLQSFVIALDDDGRQTLDRLFHLLFDLCSHPSHPKSAAADLVCAILHFYDHVYHNHQRYDVEPKSHEHELFDRFITLVNRNGGTERQLAYYADCMNLSQRYLGTVINKVSDVTAKEWIDRAAIAHIKVMLRHSNLPIKCIADSLNFPNNSFFCKYFKRLTGMTPAQYKRQ